MLILLLKYCIYIFILLMQSPATFADGEMQKEQVIPDVIPNAPAATLEVKYNGESVQPGAKMTPTKVKDPPQLKWNLEAGKLYLLAMVDPDAPSRKSPKNREWLHWLVGNIPGKDIKNGEVITDYVGACPPQYSGLHRYVLLVYKQPDKISYDEPRQSKKSHDKRGQFKIAQFAAKYKLRDPIAGNFFLAEYDEYVSKIHAECCKG